MKALSMVAAAVLLAACQKPAAPEPPPLTRDEINADRVWKRITVETDFDDYPFWPGHEGVRLGQSPHGKFHEIYINKTLRDALPSPSGKAPVGSVIVKENLDSSRKLTKISVMVKVEGFNPSGGDWWWANFDPAGKTTTSGVVRGCIACHEGMKDNDYVIVKRLSER